MSTLLAFYSVTFHVTYDTAVVVVVVRSVVIITTVGLPEISRISVVMYVSELFVEGKV